MAEKEYIEREAALRANCYFCSEHLKDDSPCPEKCADYMKFVEIPAADVRPVVRAEFVRCGDGKGVPYMCSHCGRTTPANMVEIWGVNFCPNCGAWMEES